MPKPVVYIASPYTKGDVAMNTHFQCKTFDTLLTDGKVWPIAPLRSHFQHTVFPRPYADWIAYDQALLPLYDACLRLDVMTSPESHPWRFGEENVSLLAECAASAPDQIMETVGRYILNRERRTIFAVSVYHGLFEAIGVDAVRNWVNEHGRENLRWIARHFQSPSRNARGETILPPLTQWLFTEREDDQEAFEWFLMGRRSGARMWSGNQSAAKQEEMQPYLQHPLRRVREWAEDEIRFFVNEDARFREFEDESERL